MRQGKQLRLRLTVLGVLGLALFNYPLLGLVGGNLAGLPGAFVYLFGGWAALIGAAAWLAEQEGE